MVARMIMAMWLVVCRHAQHSKDAVKDGALIEVCKAGRAGPAEQVSGYLENVVLCAGLLSLCPVHMLHRAASLSTRHRSH